MGRPRRGPAARASRCSRTAGWSRCSARWRRRGAILKRSAADPKLFEREGRAVVFTSLEDLAARIDDPELDVTPGRFPGAAECRADQSPSGMPEAGYLPIPAKAGAGRGQGHGAHLRRAHERHRLWHDRLHVTPDAASGGPLAKVRNGDRIRLSVEGAAHRPAGRRRTNWRAARPRRRRCPSAAMPGSTASRSCRPTAAAISTSCASTRLVLRQCKTASTQLGRKR